MRERSEDNVYNLSITGEGEKSFPSIEFSNVGSYNYIIYQLAGEAANAIYDTTVYKVIVYVLNSEIAEDTLITYVVIRNEVTGEKVKEVAFTNRYAPDVPKTGDNSNFVLYVTLCIVFAVAIPSIVLFGKKRKNSI